MSLSFSRKRGFTVTELMVVVLSTLLMLALGLPAFQGIRRQHRAAACLQNLSRIGTLIHLYAGDHNGTIHPGGNNRAAWPGLMAESYLHYQIRAGNSRRFDLFYCPEMVALGHTGNSGITSGYWTTYCINAQVMGTGHPTRPLRRMSEFEEPSRIGLLWDAATFVSGAPNRSVAAIAAYHLQSGNPNQSVGYVHGHTDRLGRHGGKAGTLFLDGHAQFLADPGNGAFLPIRRTGTLLW